jgi:hypothetical protein
MDKRNPVFVIYQDGRSTLDCIAESFKMKGSPNPGAGLIWGLILSLFLSLSVGILLAVFCR